MKGTIDLPGRKDAFKQLEMAIANARLAGKRLLVALVDVDRFYRVNEAKGTEFGNYALIMIAKRLAAAGRALSEAANSAISRIEGNTFLAIMEVGQETSNDWRMVEAIKYAVEQPISDDGKELYLTSSIGASLFPQDGYTSEQLICRSESALHQTKENGGNRVLFYNKEDTLRMNRRIAVESALRPALSRGQFYLSYLPSYRLSDGRIKGFEALIRWKHPELGNISPGEFIPIAEHNGLMVPIGEWVLREACKMLAGLTQYGSQQLTMSINISPVQLIDPRFPGMVLNVVREYGLQPHSIELEITEHIMIHSSDLSLSALTRLRAAGFRIVLDDFGTGYSSISNLKQLPIHGLKIDKSFVKQIDRQSAERHIVEAIVSLVQKLGLEVTAEGVEFIEQYELLKQWGCDYVQGFLFGQPMEPTKIDTTMFRTPSLS
ncbi:putative bifunctional diguanylate cyclase/phosphodiesterase [Paenibacillus sp. GCM10027627]|uniref:putative bifunctional diguanylate cyclase/phosphodiesterase n=1 Tax=unclassified Paenibacillus TaxID=185978 RepID=UPI0036404E8C